MPLTLSMPISNKNIDRRQTIAIAIGIGTNWGRLPHKMLYMKLLKRGHIAFARNYVANCLIFCQRVIIILKSLTISCSKAEAGLELLSNFL